MSDARLLLPSIAQALGATEDECSPHLERLKNSLGGRHLLMFLDDFEQVLVTSRAALWLLGERALRAAGSGGGREGG